MQKPEQSKTHSEHHGSLERLKDRDSTEAVFL